MRADDSSSVLRRDIINYRRMIIVDTYYTFRATLTTRALWIKHQIYADVSAYVYRRYLLEIYRLPRRGLFWWSSADVWRWILKCPPFPVCRRSRLRPVFSKTRRENPLDVVWFSPPRKIGTLRSPICFFTSNAEYIRSFSSSRHRLMRARRFRSNNGFVICRQ